MKSSHGNLKCCQQIELVCGVKSLLPNGFRLQFHELLRPKCDFRCLQIADVGLEGDTLLRPCSVVASASELSAAAGDDVFMCDHMYDTAWDVSVSSANRCLPFARLFAEVTAFMFQTLCGPMASSCGATPHSSTCNCISARRKLHVSVLGAAALPTTA